MLDHGAGEGFTFGTIVGKSREMEQVYQVLPTLAQNDTSVLITGETGTGKDLVAEAIHQASARAKGPFIKVNCGALPENLLESELFGHRKGAFTGAVENKPGWFRLAHNGTLFLTEIGDLPLPLQVKLLTFLDDKVIYPLGSTKGIHVDVRIIAATHRDLQEMVVHGRFRQDLLFRLNVIRLHLPPLRERGEDIRLLVDHFLRVLSQRFKKNVRSISREALAVLLEYPYPGNVRELRNIIEYGLTLCTSDRIEPEHLPAYMTEVDTPRQPVSERSPSVPERRRTDRHATWDSLEREMIQSALVACSGNKGETSKKLGWSRSTLWRKMKKHGIG
jgi:transcriptional regulator with PAS, ATPase and Fis domain